MTRGMLCRARALLLFGVGLTSSQGAVAQDRSIPFEGLLPAASTAERAVGYQIVAEPSPGKALPEHWADNPNQGLTACFSDGGVAVRPQGDPRGRVLLAQQFVGWGRPGALTAAASAEVSVRGSRIEYRRGKLIEWYVNEPRGIEQGFTILEPPEGGGSDESIEVRLALSSDLPLIEESDTGGLVLRDQDGSVRLRYEGLMAWDSSGRFLPCRLQRSTGHLSIIVETGEPVYPVIIDPIIAIQDQKLLAVDDFFYYDEQFGYSVAIEGNTAVVGTPGANIPGGTGVPDRGMVYVFIHNGVKWQIQAKLTSSQPARSHRFGKAVAISGDTVVVGLGPESSGTYRGVADVFVRSGGVWAHQARLTGNGPGWDGTFGDAVAVSDDTIAVGAWREDEPDQYSGSVYVFVRNGSSWSQQVRLNLPSPARWTYFGRSVALDGDTLIVGTPGEHLVGGAGYVFVRSGSSWSQQAKLTSLLGPHNIGVSASISGETAVLGDQDGAAVFQRYGVIWRERARLVPSDGQAGSGFGYSVSIDADTILVGAYTRDEGSLNSVGGAYLFERLGTTWIEQDIVKPSDGQEYDYFGWSVAHTSDWLLVGARLDDNVRDVDAGAAYTYWLCHDEWNDVGSGLAGNLGIPNLIGCGSLQTGSEIVLSMKGAKRLAPAALIVGSSALNMPFRGGTLVPNDDVLFLPVMVNGSQGIRLEETLSVGFPTGTTLYAQFWIQDAAGVLNYSASNAIRQTAP